MTLLFRTGPNWAIILACGVGIGCSSPSATIGHDAAASTGGAAGAGAGGASVGAGGKVGSDGAVGTSGATASTGGGTTGPGGSSGFGGGGSGGGSAIDGGAGVATGGATTDAAGATVGTDANVPRDAVMDGALLDTSVDAPSGGTRDTSDEAAIADVAPRVDASVQGFVHPGLLLTSGDLARMKEKIAAKSEPWYGQYTTLMNDQNSSATKAYNTPPAIIGRNAASAYATDRYACEADAVLAFQNALVFALTGQTAHAALAVKILNAYAAGVKHFDTLDPERDLEAAILGWLWVETAELVRYSGNTYTGWTAADIAIFGTWIHDVVYADTAYNATGVLVTPLPNGAGARGAFGLRTKMAIGIYLDDKTIYNEAVDYFFNGKGNGAPSYYILPSTGQTWEAGRDQGHAQGGLCRLMETAHMAHNQGNETLYAWQNNALSRAIEYIASYNLGNDVPYSLMQPFTTSWADTYPAISAIGRGEFQPIYELPYYYWHSIKGLNMPFTLQAIGKEVTETFSPQNDNPMFATLSYRQ